MNKATLIPAQIWEGNKETLQKETQNFLKGQFCKSQLSPGSESCSCIECKKIKSLQHPNLLWLSPPKNYSVEDITQILKKTRLTLDENQKFFFVLENAQHLTLSTANRLLKLLEEPPPGYNFILLTNNIQAILPTISSRCLIKQFHAKKDLEIHPLLSSFHGPNKLLDPVTFTQELKAYGLSENESVEMLNDLLQHFSNLLLKLYQSSSLEEKELEFYEKIVSFLKNLLLLPPQPGSTNLFWKNLYLNFPRKEQSTNDKRKITTYKI